MTLRHLVLFTFLAAMAFLPSAASQPAEPTIQATGAADPRLASFDALGRLRTEVAKIIDAVRPAAIITFGPEGGTGHPDHRLVGDVVTQIVQSDVRYRSIDVLYASLPTERLRTAPPSSPSFDAAVSCGLSWPIRF